MAKKKKARPAGNFEDLQDVGFQQSAGRTTQPSPATPAAPVTAAPAEQEKPKPGTRTSSGIAGTELLTNQSGQNVLVYGGSNTRVVPGQAAPAPTPVAGTIIGYDYLPGKTAANSARRRARIADGSGGFTYGEYEENPGYVIEPGESIGPIPGVGGTTATGEKTLAVDTFVNTLALLIGEKEASKPYIKELFPLVAAYYRTGSSIDEATNLALREAKLKNIAPEFTKRFRGIFALEDMRKKGIPVDVPTIAEYVKSQEQLSETLRSTGLADLATEDFMNDIFSTGKSVAESTGIIADVFNAIDLAPEQVKQQIRQNLPFADRTTLAKALLTGEKGIAELEKMRTRSEVQAAAAQTGLSLSERTAQELANAGFTYRTSAPRFGEAKQISQRGTFLTGLTGGPAVTQEQAISAVFDQSANELETLGKIQERERLRFQGQSGAVKLASQARGSAGLF